VQITVPDGFEPEAPTAPAPNIGEALQHQLKLSYDRKNRTIHAVREFASHLLDLPADKYQPLKRWYDAIARADQHEVVFLRSAKSAEATTGSGL
jgi:hypothetical protein